MLWKKYLRAVAAASLGQNGGGAQNGGFVAQTTSFDPARTDSLVPPASIGIGLSNSNRTASWIGTPSGFSSGNSLGTVLLSTGKHYIEYVVGANTNLLSYAMGISNGVDYYLYYGNNLIQVGGSVVQTTSPSITPDVGDIVGMHVDFDNGKLWIWKNNSVTGGRNPSTGASPDATFTPNTGFRAWAYLNSNGGASPRPSITGNFLTAQETYTPFSGYIDWSSGGFVTSGPSAFTFTDQNPVEHSTVCTSALIYITGITGSLTASITGGTMSIGGDAYSATSRAITNNQSLQARVTSSASDSTAVNAVVTINGVSDTFTATTGDSVPDAFTFTDVTGVITGSTQESLPVMISGLTISSPITVSGDSSAKYSINGGSFTASAGVVYNGDLVRAQVIASSSISTAISATVAINGVSDTFTATTASTATTNWSTANYYNATTTTTPPPTTAAINTYTARSNNNKTFNILSAADALGFPLNVLTNTSQTTGKKYFEIQLGSVAVGNELIGLYDSVTGNLFQYFFANGSGTGASLRANTTQHGFVKTISSVTVINGGSGYSALTHIVVDDDNDGDNPTFTVTRSNGVITAVTLTGSGGTYAVNDGIRLFAVDVAGTSGFRKNINNYANIGTFGAQGDIFGCAVDLSTRLMWVHKNGVYINNGNPATQANGYAMDAGSNATFAVAGGLPSGNQITGKFMASDLSFPIPSGYGPWDTT